MSGSNKDFRGVGKDLEVNTSLIRRDTKSFLQKARTKAFRYQNTGMTIGGSGLLMTILPLIGISIFFEVLMFVSIFFFLFYSKVDRRVLLSYPMTANPNHVPNGAKMDGMYFLGNEFNTNYEYWTNKSAAGTHFLVFGTTGSGKTRFLLGLMYQTVMMGSGVLYADGKGDTTVFYLVFTFCRRVGRQDDLRVINYLTGGDSKINDGTDKTPEAFRRITNTNNLFSSGNASQVRSIIMGLMRDSGGGGDSWKGMAAAMMAGLLMALVELRDLGEITLDVNEIRSNMTLNEVIRLSQDKNLTHAAQDALRKYLLDLPGYVEEEALLGRINPKVNEQHGYRTMQFTEVLADLQNTYGHIFDAPLGEVNFQDLVFSNRILFVMLPALEKDPDALAGLGKLIVSGVRAAISPGLGNQTEGSEAEISDAKPTDYHVPFMLILDEYGYYSVPGFAVTAAQGRSLGISIVFAGQDYASMEKASKEEARATLANTNHKIGMKLDEEDTAKIIIDRGAEADIYSMEGREKLDGKETYKDSDRFRVERTKRIDYRDLLTQGQGEGHILYSDIIARSRLYFADPKVKAPNSYINKYLMVRPPSITKVKEIKKSYEDLDNALLEAIRKEKEGDEHEAPAKDKALSVLFDDYLFFNGKTESSKDAASMAIGLADLRDNYKDLERLESVKDEENEVNVDAQAKSENKSEGQGSEKSEKTINSPKSTDNQVSVTKNDGTIFDGDNEEETLAAIDDKEAPANHESVSSEAEVIGKRYIEVLSSAVIDTKERDLDRPLTKVESDAYDPENQIRTISSSLGQTPEEANKTASASMDMLSAKSKYTIDPVPAKMPIEESLDFVKGLYKTINES